MRRRLALSASVGAAGTAAWKLLDLRDRRAVADDPDHAALTTALPGRPVAVRSADGTTLHAEVHGPEEGATVVLVHGWICSSIIWHHQIRALSLRRRIVVYDQRGHGRSEAATTGDYSSGALAADLDAVLHQAVPAGTRVVVAGHSMGAMAVVAWAHRHRHEVADRLASAVLVNTGVEDLISRSTLVPFPAVLSKLRGPIGEWILGAPLPLPSRSNPLLFRLVRSVALGPAASPAEIAFCTEMLINSRTEARAAFGATLAAFDLDHGLPALRVPTVIVAGQCDRITPPVHARSIAATLPQATLVELPGVGHTAPLEAAPEVSHQLDRLACALVPGRSRPQDGLPAKR